MYLAPKINKEMGYVDFKTWTADYCHRVYRAIGKEVSIVFSLTCVMEPVL